MHTLSREVRFTIDPFDTELTDGYNSYASKPSGQGVGMYFSLWVDLQSHLNPQTGFVINVSEVDKLVRLQAIPLFQKTVQSSFEHKKALMLRDMVSLLRNCWKVIQENLEDIRLKKLRLVLSPFRQIMIRSEDAEMFIYSEKFEFAAMHRLWNDTFDEATNYELFGKCANPAGHGHNYVLEVQVQSYREELNSGWMNEYQKVVKEYFVDIVDHKNLNVDVLDFEKLNPTVENLARFAWEMLEEKFTSCKLYSIKLWENDRTYCIYCE